MVKHTKGFKGLSKKVLSAILAASMIMTSSSFVMAAETEEPVPVESTANDVETTEETEVETEEEAEVEETEETTNNIATFSEPDPAPNAVGQAEVDTREVKVDFTDDGTYTYNGQEQKPELTVSVNTGTTESPVWEEVSPSNYTLAYSNNKDVTGTENEDKAKVVVSFVGDEPIGSHGDYTAYFSITPLDLRTVDVDVDVDQTIKGFVYDGEKQYPTVESVKVTLNDEKKTVLTLSEDDYEVGGAYKNAEPHGFYDLTSAGEQVLRINGKGNFSGYVGGESNPALKYTIDPAKLSEELVNIQVKDKKYDGIPMGADEIKKLITITDKADESKTPMNISVEVRDNDGEDPVDIGTYNIRIKVQNSNYDVDSYIDTTFDIVASESLEDVVKDNLNIVGWSQVDGVWTITYDGKDKFIANSSIEFSGALKVSDYEVVTPETEWINAGDYEIVIEGRNTYSGQTVTIPVKIQPRSLIKDNKGSLIDDADVVATQGKHQSGRDGEVIVYIHDEGVYTENSDLYVLEEGVDYTYTVKNVSENKKEVEITGIGNYTTSYNDGKGTVYTEDVEITDTLDLNDPSISVEITGDYDWTGSQVKPPYSAIKVTEQDGSTVRTLTTSDYQVIYGENVKAGEGTITLVGKPDNYSGERVVTFKINGVSFADTFEVEKLEDVVKGTTTVTEIKNDAVVTYKATGAKYNNVSKKLYKDGKEVTTGILDENGEYTLIIESTDSQFEGSIEVTFNVIGEDLKKSGAKVANIEDQVYTSEAIEPSVVVTIGEDTLVEGEDYTVSYTDNVKGGEATAIVTGINDYSGTIEKNFNITRAAQSIVMTNPLQERDLANGSRTTKSNVCTLKLDTTMADEDTKYTYKSSDLSVATVNAGKITYQGVGECTITVSAAATDSCEAASLDITVKVGKPGQPTFTPSVTSKTAKKSITVTSSTVRGADGFEVQYSVRSDWWRASIVDFDGTNNKLYRQTIKTYHSNKKYYIRVRAYQVVDGAKVYSDWSPAKTATTK